MLRLCCAPLCYRFNLVNLGNHLGLLGAKDSWWWWWGLIPLKSILQIKTKMQRQVSINQNS